MPSSSGFTTGEVLTAANTNTYLLRPYTNAIINGGMTIAQRASSQAGIGASGYWTADRWFQEVLAAGIWTQTVQALGASDAPLQDGVRNSIKITCTSAQASLASGAYNTMQQRIEGFNLQQFSKGTANAKHFALSFWVRTNVPGTYVAELYDTTNNRQVSRTYTISAAGVWQKIRIVYPPDFTGLINNDNANRLFLILWLAAGSQFQTNALNTVWNSAVTGSRSTGQVNSSSAVNNYWEMTAAQLEPNNICTPFQVRQYGEELALCQRYYYRINGWGTDDGLCQGNYYNTTQLWSVIQHPVMMRAAPSAVGINGTYNAYAIAQGNPVSSITAYTTTPQTATMYFTTVFARTHGVGGWIATANGALLFNAEL